MALIDPDAVILLHPYSRPLNVYLAQLWNRAENASDTDQQTAITTAVQAAVDARDTPTTIQRAEFTVDPAGHLGRHLKWMLSETVYRSLSNADIATDLDSIATGAGVGGIEFANIMTVGSFWTTYRGYSPAAGAPGGTLVPDTFDWYPGGTMINLYASPTVFACDLTGGPSTAGKTFDMVIEGYDDNNPIAMNGAGTAILLATETPGNLQAYWDTVVGQDIGISIVETTP